jgi:hypothetical protein
MKTFIFSALLLIAADADASVIYTVTLDTSNGTFSNAPPAPLSLAFEFADGSGTGDGNNSVTLSNFSFGGGSPSGSPFLSGSVTGDLSSSIQFTDSQVTNIFFEGFTAGSTLQFNISLTTNVDAGGIPDEFVMSLLDSTLSPIPTTSSSPLYPLVDILIDSSNPTVTTYAASPQQPAAGGFITFSAPSVEEISSVPEPGSMALCALPVMWFIWRGRRRASARGSAAKARLR